MKRVPLDDVSSRLVAEDADLRGSPPRRVPVPDVRDVLVFGGLAVVGVGVWWIFPAAALIVIGAALFALGIRGV